MDQQQLFVKMGLGVWDLQIGRIEKMLSAFTDEQLLHEIAPGKNRVIYLLGHLVAYHDMLAETMGIGTRTYAHLDEAFLKNADKAGFDMPDAAYLRNAWGDVHQKLAGLFNDLSPADWFVKHNAVSEDDFAKDPTRNRLNMVINRAGHVAYHAGQIKLA
ncbi:MAG: DinB family protein [Bacteroidota bacterium]